MRMAVTLALTGLLTAAVAMAEGSSRPLEADTSQVEGRRVSLVWVHDIHAQLEPHAELFWHDDTEAFVENVGGVARMATVFNRLRQERPDELLFIDGGDTIQGSGPAAWTHGQVVIEPMNMLGLDMAVPGNWSVAYGAKHWRDRASEFNYPVIAANMFDVATGELLFEPYMIREIKGVRVGVIGFTEPDMPTRQPPHLSDGLAFADVEVLPPLIAELREDHNVDVVVVATHIGLPKAVGLAEALEGVDIVLSSDTHERTYEPIIRGDTWIVEAGAFASFVGVLDIMVDDQGAIADRAWRLIELRPEYFPQDPEVKQVVEAALAPHRERMNRVIGYTDVWLARYEVVNTSLDNLIAQAIRDITGADVALSNGFRFAPPTAPGPITVADLWTWLPLRLELKTGVASGAQLQDYWENELENVFSTDPQRIFGGWVPRCAGLAVYFEKDAGPGQRVRELAVDDKPLDYDRMYTIAAGHREGAPDDSVHRVRGCEFTKKAGITTHDAVERYLKLHSPIRSEGKRNVRCNDCPTTLRSQILHRIE